MRPLTYSDYINDAAIIESLRIPQPPPAGQTPETWPTWHAPAETGAAGASVAWSPGDPWPRGGNWAHDEVLFIRTHQAFEVWFALILHELDDVLVGATDACRAAGAALPRVTLDHRAHEAAPHRAADFPAIEREAVACGAPDIADRIRRMATPGRHRVETNVRLEWFSSANLRIWASRVRRASLALRTTIPFFDVLAMMTPDQFLKFRGRLVPASGFGSCQFRELELSLGLREANAGKLRPPGGLAQAAPGGPPLPDGMLRPGPATPPGVAANSFYATLPPRAWRRVARRYGDASLRDVAYTLCNVAADVLWPGETAARAALDEFAARNIRETVSEWRQSGGASGQGGAESLLTDRIDEIDELLSHRETIVAAWLKMAPAPQPQIEALDDLLDACLHLDESLLFWRDRHLRFVERMIGTRRGTGGGGIKYLRGTIDPQRGAYHTHAVPCLWQARSLVQKA